MPALRRLSRGGLVLVLSSFALLAAFTGDDEPQPDGSATAPSSAATPSRETSSTETPSTETPCGEAAELVMGDLPRGVVEPAAADAVSDATTVFASDLYAALVAADGGDGGNLVFSPYSAAVALAMTREGARGQTAVEMDAVLHADLAGGAERLGAGFNGLDQALAAIPGEYPFGDETLILELATANQLFGQAGLGFDQAFLDRLAANYGAGMGLVDYETASEDARQQINAWVGEQTRERIPELIPQGAIDDATRLVLTNAIYLKAPWQHRFEEVLTADGPFTLRDGSEVTASFMRQTATFSFGGGDGYQAVELPYVGGQLSMLLVVPDAGSFDAVEAALDGEAITSFGSEMQAVSVVLAMPHFEFRTQSPLRGALSDLGMPTAFTDAADFSGITSEASLLIADVLHEAFISVDEEGTEAAAATAVVTSVTSIPAEQVELTIDRPFLFLIREVDTGAVLFMGRVMDPSAE